MKFFILGLAGIILLVLIINLSVTGRKGTGRFDTWRKSGKGMTDDFDKERKDLDNLMK